MGDWTGTVPSHSAGAKSKASKLQTLDDILTALTGPLTATWNPTLTNLTVGNGTQTTRYRRLGSTIDWYWQFLLGSTSVVGTTPSFTLPAAPAAYYSTGRTAAFPANVHLLQTTVTERQGGVKISSGSTLVITFWNATPAQADITATTPWTWAAGHYLTAWGTYEAA